MDKTDLVKTLLGIDEEAWLSLGEMNPKPRVLIVGGAALMLHDVTPRKVTHDIDIYHADSVVRDILSRYPQVNGSVSAYMDQIPYNYEDRLMLLDIGTRAIDFFTPSIEDVLVMKLYAERPNDIQDIDGAIASGSIDWNLLEKLVYDEDEAQASALSERRYREMVGAFERTKKRCGR